MFVIILFERLGFLPLASLLQERVSQANAEGPSTISSAATGSKWTSLATLLRKVKDLGVMEEEEIDKVMLH